VKRRQLDAHLDALAAGQRPEPGRADPEDVEILRSAIELRAARPGDAVPDQQFISNLRQELADRADSPVVTDAPPHRTPPRRLALVSVAAALALVGGTVAVTEAVDQPVLAPAAVQAPHQNEVRTGTFETADNRVMGQIVAYDGNPSWVYMHVEVPNYEGRIICTLQARNGSTVAAGVFDLKSGMGGWSKTIRVGIHQLRGAKLVDPSGTTLAEATFA
jgi:hypothetical protein